MTFQPCGKPEYAEVLAEYGAALARLARGYEANPDRRRDLVQEIQIALWNSLARFDGRCSLRTWVYRVAHNTGAKHVMRERRSRISNHVSVEALESMPASGSECDSHECSQALAMLLASIHKLRPTDRQLMLLYLEDLDAASIAEVTGLTPRNVATKIHRIKQLLTTQFQRGSST
jgi:RNA polymerase sigma-70 factor (ECF subfamily)